MKAEDCSPDFLSFLRSITSKRAARVIAHILEFGFVTTEDITNMGYEHAPRAARDVREQGVPLETCKVRNSDGKQIAAYRFGNPAAVRRDRIGGRQAFSKAFKARLMAVQNNRCGICFGAFEDRYLQVDHRVPYEVAGDSAVERDIAEYMLLCGSCNRAKSWSCEHCDNFTELREPVICKRCYWASPEAYDHIALEDARRLDLMWQGSATRQYDAVKAQAEAQGAPLPEYVKAILKKRRLPKK